MPPLNSFQKKCLAVTLSQIVSLPLQAATISVDSSFDALDADRCTLRAAILSANTDTAVDSCQAGSGNDIITFDLLNNSTITLTSGDLPTITSNITINGPGFSNLEINGDGNSRIFSLTNYANLSFSSMTISNGSSISGAAIYSNTGTVTVNNSLIVGNTAFNGGAIYARSSNVTINDSIVLNNQANNHGGGVHTKESRVTINDSYLLENDANQRGGGVYTQESVVTIDKSLVSSNSATVGGGLRSGNCTLNIVNSTVFSNTASSGGGIYTGGSDFFMTNSTVSNNYVYNSGAGLSFYRGDIEVTNSTISGNVSDDDTGGIRLVLTSSMIIRNSILSGNKARNTFNGLELHISRGTNINVIAENNIFGDAGSTNLNAFYMFVPSNNNILATSDELNIPLNQIIEPLVNNGGNTLIHTLPSASPAIGAASTSECPTTDQRGNIRDEGFFVPIVAANNNVAVVDLGGDCDIGAIEFSADD